MSNDILYLVFFVFNLLNRIFAEKSIFTLFI